MSLQRSEGEISSVASDSLGEELGLRPGDLLLAINGHRLRDVIDYQYYGAEEYFDNVIFRERAVSEGVICESASG
ncbi:MAG: PDZ domain-containing protein [Chloroflexota bacterium]|nr:PDZ domain-containing protein [Chloroflexota bacterium]